MNIFVINLDRHSQRWQRMQNLLQGLDFKRIRAVEGKNMEGREWRDPAQPLCHEALSRYERACIMSHRLAMEEFLAGSDSWGCVLEDDVFISPDFARFINDETWIPEGCGVMKIESCAPGFYIARKSIACLDRRAAMPRSLNFGAAAYLISRRGAQILLAETLRPNRTIDRILFDEFGLQKWRPVYQLMPALCIQANQLKAGVIFPELASSVQPVFHAGVSMATIPARKSLRNKIKRELTRPFCQLVKYIQPVQRAGRDWCRGVRFGTVPFA